MSRVKGGYVTRRRRKKSYQVSQRLLWSQEQEISHSKPGCYEVPGLCVSR